MEVVLALPERYWSARLDMQTGNTVGEAIDAALPLWQPGLPVDRTCLANFGRPTHQGALLRDGDRIELLRPLQADPMERRRERAQVAVRKKR